MRTRRFDAVRSAWRRAHALGAIAFGAIALCLGTAGCLEADSAPSDAELVEHVWQLVDTRYALFEDKPEVDWSAALSQARAQLASAPQPVSDAQLFDLVSEMLAVLDDQHTNLATSFDVSGDLARTVDGPRTYDADLVERQVLEQGYRRASGAIYARFADDIGYLRLSSFDAVPSEAALDEIFAGFADAPGLIVDLRSNGGGSLEDMFRLLSRLVDRSTAGIQVSFSAGPAHDALTAPESRDFDPADGPRYTGPLVVLVDRHTYSAANTFTFVIRRRGNVTLVGESTGGGGGLPRWVELPNGWLLRLSTGRMTDADGRSMEPGIAPDVGASLDAEARSMGRDSMISAARAVFLDAASSD